GASSSSNRPGRLASWAQRRIFRFLCGFRRRSSRQPKHGPVSTLLPISLRSLSLTSPSKTTLARILLPHRRLLAIRHRETRLGVKLVPRGVGGNNHPAGAVAQHGDRLHAIREGNFLRQPDRLIAVALKQGGALHLLPRLDFQSISRTRSTAGRRRRGPRSISLRNAPESPARLSSYPSR